MKTVSTIGLDIAKSVFQVHGVDEAGHKCFAAGSGVNTEVPAPQQNCHQQR